MSNQILARVVLKPWRSTKKYFSGLSPFFAQLHIIVGFSFLVAVINSFSVTNDLTRHQIIFEQWEPWCWELTSWFGLAAGFIVVLSIYHWTGQRPLAWFKRLGLYIFLSLGFSLFHLAIMISLRLIFYSVKARHYDFGPFLPGFIYEYRKDLVPFWFAIGLAYFWTRSRDRFQSTKSAFISVPKQPFFLAPGKNGTTIIHAREIFWVEAQGNYVALHTENKTALIRQSMKAMEQELLGVGFYRTHRSALINLSWIKAIRRSEPSDCIVELLNGEQAPLTPEKRVELINILSEKEKIVPLNSGNAKFG